MRNKKFCFVLVLTLFFTLTACSSTDTTPDENLNTEAENGNTNDNKNDLNISEVIYDQWEKSGHFQAVSADDPENAPGLNESGNCFSCHNGYAFENNAESLEGIGILKGASCDTCHTKHGREVLEDGVANIALGEISGGKGSLCISCHNGRGKEPDQKLAPHHSVQADILLSKSGAETEGFDYGRSAHSALEETCLSCHMAENSDGIKDHQFKMSQESVANSCGQCHDFDTLSPQAKGDYDGNGSKEGVQEEIEGLLQLIEEKITEELNGGKFESSHGQIVFTASDGSTLTEPPSPEIYNAAWNYFLVKYDGSNGIHNTTYAVQLLQQSYKALTGSDVPDADIR